MPREKSHDLQVSSSAKFYDQAMIRKRFYGGIWACFENYQIDHCKDPIQFKMNDKTEMLTFQKFHQIATNMVIYDSNPGAIYTVYRSAITKWFQEFSLRLRKQIREKPKNDRLAAAKHLIHFWINFQRNVVPYLNRVFMYAERLKQKHSDEMNVRELTCYLFVREVFGSSVGTYITDLLVPYVISKHQQIQQYLSEHRSDDLIKYLTDDEMSTMISLMEMVVSLDLESKMIFIKMFEIPFLERNLPPFFSQLTENLLFQKSKMTILDYLQFGSMFLEHQINLLKHLRVPIDSIKQMIHYSTYLLFTRNIHHIIYEEKSGFSAMLDSHSYEKMAKLYSLLNMHSRQADQKALMQGLIDFVGKYRNTRIKYFTDNFDCQKRHTAIKFVLAMIREREHWNTVQAVVFKNDSRFTGQIMDFYVDLLKINDRVSQSLAYFLHDLLSRESTVVTKTDDESSRRSQLMAQLCSIIAYLPDVNQFYDFTKHYFITRLLTRTSKLNIREEINQLEQVNQVIRVNHMCPSITTSQLPAPPGIRNVSSTSAPPPPPTGPKIPEQRRSFMQNLNDFRNLYKDHETSGLFFETVFRPKEQRNSQRQRFLESFSVLHCGYWKFTDYEQCWIPQRILRSLQEFEQQYTKEYDGRMLLINTRFSYAQVSMALDENAAKRELVLIMTLSQLAIVMALNPLVNGSARPVTYDTLLQQARFLRECNFCNSLLSLIYCGLVRQFGSRTDHNLDLSKHEFIVDTAAFGKLVLDRLVQKNLSRYELVDFFIAKPLDPQMDMKKFQEIVNLVLNGHDLPFQASYAIVSEQNLQNILHNSQKLRMVSFNQMTPANGSKKASTRSRRRFPGRDHTPLDDRQARSSTSISLETHYQSPRGEMRPSGVGATGSGTSMALQVVRSRTLSDLIHLTDGTPNNTTGESASSQATVPQGIQNGNVTEESGREKNSTESPVVMERMTRVEAAVVRVLKQARNMPNMLAVFRAVHQEGHRQAAKVQSTEQSNAQSPLKYLGFTVEEVRTALVRLVKKNFLRRTESGGFEYIID